jgi:hypothetical protein
MYVLIIGFLAFCAVLAPIVLPRFWMVAAAGVLSLGLFAFINWNALTAVDPDVAPSIAAFAQPAIKDALVYSLFASVLYWIKRLILSSTPRKP